VAEITLGVLVSLYGSEQILMEEEQFSYYCTNSI
jgi:hypothetical protein